MNVDDNHWVLFAAYPRIKIMQCIDSKGNNARTQLLEEMKNMFAAVGCKLKWTSGTLTVNQQPGNTECGVYVCMRVVSLCFGISVEDWPSMEDCRSMITHTIATGTLEIQKSVKVMTSVYAFALTTVSTTNSCVFSRNPFTLF